MVEPKQSKKLQNSKYIPSDSVGEFCSLVNFFSPMSDGVYRVHKVHDLVKESKYEVLRALLDKEPENVNVIDKKGLAPIHIAAYTGDLAVLRLLLSRGANKELKRPDGMAALLIAAMRGTVKHAEVRTLALAFSPS